MAAIGMQINGRDTGVQEDSDGGILLAAAAKAAGHIAAAKRRPLGEAGLQIGLGDLRAGPRQLLQQ
jgi:hypothetical protein